MSDIDSPSIHDRRAILKISPNPGRSQDYVTTLEHRLIGLLGADHRADVVLRYVPDRHVLVPSSFAIYLDALVGPDWTGLEDAAVTILNDLANEVLPRWQQVSIRAAGSEPGVQSHGVVLEDRQPNWKNDELIARLKPY